MSQIKYYLANEDFSSEETLYDFINVVKKEFKIFGEDLPFDSNIWDITKTNPGKQNTRQSIVFSNLENSKETSRVNEDNIVPLREPFLSFTKAYLRYKQGMAPINSFTPLIASMRVLEQALIQMTQTANPVNITSAVLNRAVGISEESFGEGVAYRQGIFFQKLSEFITEKRISKIPLDWKNSAKRPCDAQRVGKKADERRNQKMPSARALEALPEIFNKANDPKDILITSIIAILFGSPDRIGEVLLIQEYCEVIQKDSKGKECYGLRWYPEKGAEPMVKWIISSMADTVKKAIERIRKLTEPAREVARWYDNNPDKIYLPKELEYLRKKATINSDEAALILYGGPAKFSMTSVYKTLKVDYVVNIKVEQGTKKKITRKETIVSFKELESGVLRLLPENFPYIDKEKKFKYSETLLIQRQYEYNSARSTYLPLVEGFAIGFVSDALGAREKSFKSSIFEKFGYKESNGQPIKVRTHQFRHYLNTLAQKGGASQLDIAKWSGRKDVSQNAAYDHVSADEMLLLVREAIGDEGLMSGQLSKIEGIKKKVIISRDEYAELKIQTTHRTDFGVCIHDFSMMPCQLHMDCINCTEQVCIKGHKDSNERIRQRKIDVEESLKIAEEPQKDGHFGAHRWVTHKTIELQKLTQLCEIFDNDNVKDGTFIQISEASSLSEIEQSQVRQQERTGEAAISSFEQQVRLQERTGDTAIDMDEMRNLMKDF